MSAGPRGDDDHQEPVIEERGDGASPTIAQAGDDVAQLVLGDRKLPPEPDGSRRAT